MATPFGGGSGGTPGGAAGGVLGGTYPNPTFDSSRMTLNGTGQLQLPTTGSTGGMLVGGDATLYRSAAGEFTCSSAAGNGRFKALQVGAGFTSSSPMFYGITDNPTTGATNYVLGAIRTGDVANRYLLTCDGEIRWGPGSAGLDTTLNRAAAGILLASGLRVTAAPVGVTDVVRLGDLAGTGFTASGGCGQNPSAGISNSATQFLHPFSNTANIGGTMTPVGTESVMEFVAPNSFTTVSFRVRKTAAGTLGAGETITVVVRKNGADTALTVTVNGSDATPTDYTSTSAVSFAAGDRLTLRVVSSVASRTIGINWSLA